MYLTQLVRRNVLVEDDEHRFTPGPDAQAFRDERPKTKAGGNSRRYRAQKRALDKLAVDDWQQRRAGLTSQPVPSVQDGAQMETTVAEDDAVKLTVAAKRFDVHPRTIKRWILNGKLKGYRLPNGDYRASKAAIDAIFNGGQEEGDG